MRRACAAPSGNLSNSHSAHELHSGAGHFAAHFIGEAFADRRVDNARQAVFGIHRRAMNEQPRHFRLHLHFRQLDLHALKINQLLAELFALLHICQHIFQRTRGLPKAIVALPQRSRSKASINLRKPPAGTTTFSSGTVTLSRKISADGTPRKPISSSCLPKLKPGVSLCTKTAPMPLAPGSSERRQ